MDEIPQGSTIAWYAEQLEHCATTKYKLDFDILPLKHGHSYRLDMDIPLRLVIIDSFGVTYIAREDSKDSPLLLCWTMDGPKLIHYLRHVAGGK